MVTKRPLKSSSLIFDCFRLAVRNILSPNGHRVIGTTYRTKCIIPYTVSKSIHGGTGREAHSAGIAANSTVKWSSLDSN